MKRININKIMVVFFFACLFTLPSHLASADDAGATINKAGKQRMLSQRIAKDYFYAGLRIQESRARKQLEASIAEFKSNHIDLKNDIDDKNIRNMLVFVDLSLDEFLSVASKPYDADNGALILDLSEAMLEANQNVVEQLEARAKIKTAEIVNISGRQRMLAQRIAKYYISHKAGFRDQNTVQQLEKAVKEFDTALHWLQGQQKNTPQVQTELAGVEDLWDMFKKYYMDVTESDLPVIVFITSDKITDAMNRITGMYAALYGEVVPTKK
jgi:nitrate/nitrite-specific signal transduction histidine kinase